MLQFIVHAQTMLFVGILCLVALAECQRMTGVVQTDKGPVRGRIHETVLYSTPYSAFKGIPYGKPPVGHLRFMNAVEADPWTDVLNATSDFKFCAQLFGIGVVGQEDCLYIHVYTPLTDFTQVNKNELKPVMFWIYGGGFMTGYGKHSLYAPDYFLEHDVVYVMFNYRVTSLGFLALDVSGAKGNQGLKDQLLALKWVQKNIAAFGGDPNRVTIFGESAGAASVGFHMLSPRSKGLFHQAILQSGTPLSSWAFHSREEMIKNAFKIAVYLGLSTQDQQQLLYDLQQTDLKQFLLATQQACSSVQYPNPVELLLSGTLTDDFLDECPITKFQNGNFSRVPVMMGFTKYEAGFFTLVHDLERTIMFNTIASQEHPYPLRANEIINEFNNVVNTSMWKAIEENSLRYFSGPIDITQRFLAKYNDYPIFYYHMSKDGESNLHRTFNTQLPGCAHADDLGFLFYLYFLHSTDPTDVDSIYRQTVVSLWTNFAKYGNPTPNNEPINGAVWQPSGKEGLQLEIDEKFSMRNRAIDSEGLIQEQVLYRTLINQCHMQSPSCSNLF